MFKKMKYKFELNLDLPDAKVPCDGCKLCCKGTPVLLVDGDDVSTYETVLGPDGKHYLRMLENGDCAYLGLEGCTIHDRAPYACRVFDCRIMAMQYTRFERRKLIRAGVLDVDIMARGRELLEGEGRALACAMLPQK
jgi:hypothetical protein